MFAGPFASGGKRKPGLGGVSITSLNVNVLTRARKAVSGLRRRGFRDYYALKGASLRLNVGFQMSIVSCLMQPAAPRGRQAQGIHVPLLCKRVTNTPEIGTNRKKSLDFFIGACFLYVSASSEASSPSTSRRGNRLRRIG